MFLLIMIMESKTRKIGKEEILPLLYRGEKDTYEFMFFTLMLEERKKLCQQQNMVNRVIESVFAKHFYRLHTISKVRWI